jgi:hypothetical protein
MTALKEYMRLETTGLWRATPEAQRREVGVAFGDATLVISDPAGRPITHWSLPAIVCVNPGIRPAVYSPDADATESLEIEDDLMIGAIERIRQSVARRTPRPGRVRQVSLLATVLVVTVAAVVWLPGAMTQQTLSMVPSSKRSEIGATLLGHIQKELGPTCRDPLGTRALGVLKTRLFGAEGPGQIVVVPADLAQALDLPGGIIVLGRNMVEDATEPAVVAGHVISAIGARIDPDPLAPVLQSAGMSGTIRLLATGDVAPEVLESYAGALLATPRRPPHPSEIADLFDELGVPPGPWASAVAPDAPLATVAGSGAPGSAYEIILTDTDWVALQGICRS